MPGPIPPSSWEHDAAAHQAPLVFRALREDEIDAAGRLGLKPPKFPQDFAVFDDDVADPGEAGYECASPFLHTTRDPEVAFYFAERTGTSREYAPSGHQIVAIDLGQRRTQARSIHPLLGGGTEWFDFNSTVIDLSTDAGRRASGLHRESRSWKFAMIHCEVCVRGNIEPTEIVATLDTQHLRTGNSFESLEDFIESLPHTTRARLQSWADEAKALLVSNRGAPAVHMKRSPLWLKAVMERWLPFR